MSRRSSRPVRPLRPGALAACLALAGAALAPCAPVSAQAVEGFSYGDSPLAAARLGVAFAAIAELADSPALLARPSSQAFADATFAQIPLLTREPALAPRVKALRALLVPGAAGGRGAIDDALGDLERALPPALGAPRDRLFLVGALAEQVAYDARVLRDPAADRDGRAALAALDVADPYVPGLAGLRADLGREQPAAWQPIAASAARIVAALLGSVQAVPFPPSTGVWIILIRTRATPADAARGGAPHFSLDVVGFDGSHRSLAAYPGGGDEFARDAASMPCLPDREPAVGHGSGRVAPVDPPPGVTVAQFARALETGCAAASAGRLRYVVREATDDRFLTGLLVASGVDAAPLLRALR